MLCQANICICSVLPWHLFTVTTSHLLTTREGITGISDTVTGITGIRETVTGITGISDTVTGIRDQ